MIGWAPSYTMLWMIEDHTIVHPTTTPSIIIDPRWGHRGSITHRVPPRSHFLRWWGAQSPKFSKNRQKWQKNRRITQKWGFLRGIPADDRFLPKYATFLKGDFRISGKNREIWAPRGIFWIPPGPPRPSRNTKIPNLRKSVPPPVSLRHALWNRL